MKRRISVKAAALGATLALGVTAAPEDASAEPPRAMKARKMKTKAKARPAANA